MLYMSQLMITAPVLLLVALLAVTLVVVTVSTVVAVKIHKNRAKKAKTVVKKAAKTPVQKKKTAQKTATVQAAAQRTKTPQSAEERPVQPAVSTPKQPKQASGKKGLIGDQLVEEQDFADDSAYDWVYQISFRDDENWRALAWRTTDKSSMISALSHDLRFGYTAQLLENSQVDVKVKYKSAQGVEHFEQNYDLINGGVETAKTFKKSICDLLIQLSHGKQGSAEEEVAL